MQHREINTIDDVISTLDEIILHAEQKGTPVGYFPALYNKVTRKVKEGIKNGDFDDGPRMEKLDVIFAKRYIDSYFQYIEGKPTTLSWDVSYKTNLKYWPIVLQHLLIGMNAHINLDLGIAVVEVMKGKNLDTIHNDFNKINEILSSLVTNVQKDLGDIWPMLKIILKLTGKIDDLIVDFSMELARDGAWKFATRLFDTPEEEKAQFIECRDQKVARNAKIVNKPGFFLGLLLKVIRITELGSVSKKIKILQD